MIIEHPDSSHQQLILTAEFLTTIEELFNHFTKVELLTKWWPQEAKVKPDGRYHFAWQDMDWNLRGRFSTLQCSATLSFTWKWDHEVNLPERTVRLCFTQKGNKTDLSLEHGTYTLSPEDQVDRQSHLDGWQYFLPQLQKLVAS